MLFNLSLNFLFRKDNNMNKTHLIKDSTKPVINKKKNKNENKIKFFNLLFLNRKLIITKNTETCVPDIASK